MAENVYVGDVPQDRFHIRRPAGKVIPKEDFVPEKAKNKLVPRFTGTILKAASVVLTVNLALLISCLVVILEVRTIQDPICQAGTSDAINLITEMRQDFAHFVQNHREKTDRCNTAMEIVLQGNSDAINLISEMGQDVAHFVKNHSEETGHWNTAMELVLQGIRSNIEKLKLVQVEHFESMEALMSSTSATHNEHIESLEAKVDILKSMFQCETNRRTRDGTYEDWYIASNGYLYKVFNATLNYTDARNSCEGFCSRLASVGMRNATVRSEIIEELIKPFGFATWIGLDDLELQNSWMWADGVMSTRSNTAWGDGEPNSDLERCGNIWPQLNYEVNDNRCNYRHHYICEIFLLTG